MNDTDAEVLAGILAATDADALPRVVDTFDFLGHRVSIIEPTLGGAGLDGIKRGYLWHAVIGAFVLTPTRPGLYDDERWVPGIAKLLPGTGAELLGWSTKSPRACATAARAKLRKRAGAR
jgi:hypothetical protein